MRFYWPIAKVDAEQRMVWGYASTEAQDDQGETITRQALTTALADYMRFANIREMHQPSAVGVATEAAVDDRGLYLGARIVDGEAWQKVVTGVYKGFSIGGRVTARDPADRRTITGLRLTEISVVDRPANPEAVFDCWKRGGESAGDILVEPAVRTGADDLRLARLVLDLDWLSDRIAKVSDAPAPDLPTRIMELRHCVRALAMNEPLPAVGLAVPPQTDTVAAVAKLAGEIMPRLDALQQRVEDIARTPLPAQTLAAGFADVDARRGGRGMAANGDNVVAALARMTDDQRTLTLIKAAHATPVTVRGWR